MAGPALATRRLLAQSGRAQVARHAHARREFEAVAVQPEQHLRPAGQPAHLGADGGGLVGGQWARSVLRRVLGPVSPSPSPRTCRQRVPPAAPVLSMVEPLWLPLKTQPVVPFSKSPLLTTLVLPDAKRLDIVHQAFARAQHPDVQPVGGAVGVVHASGELER